MNNRPQEFQNIVQKMKEVNYYIKDPSKGTMRFDDTILLTFYEPTGEKDKRKSAVMDMSLKEAKVLIKQLASAIDMKVVEDV